MMNQIPTEWSWKHRNIDYEAKFRSQKRKKAKSTVFCIQHVVAVSHTYRVEISDGYPIRDSIYSG